MVIKSRLKTQNVKNTVKPKAVPKNAASPVNPSEYKEIKEIIDLHAKQLQKLEGMFFALQGEIKDLKRLITSKSAEKKKTTGESVTAKAAPAKEKVATKPLPKEPVKSVQAAAQKTPEKSSPVKKTVKKPAASPAKKVGKPVSKAFSDNFMAIPADFAERISTLTAKKKITQTQLGKEVDLSQKVIHEIATRKLRDLDKDKVRMISAVLKKYEGK